MRLVPVNWQTLAFLSGYRTIRWGDCRVSPGNYGRGICRMAMS